MAQAPIMPVMTDALIADTTHLSAEEFGAYFLILLATWRNNGEPLRNDDAKLARICRMSPARFSKKKHLLLEFFDISDGYLHQKRLESEWKKVKSFIDSRRANGSRGGRAKALKIQETAVASGVANSKLDASYPNPYPKKEEREESRTNGKTLNLENQNPTYAAARRNGEYSFSGKVIRLTQSDADRWRERFFTIADLSARLESLDAYYDQELIGPDRKRWFHRCSKALDNEHQENLRALKARQTNPSVGLL